MRTVWNKLDADAKAIVIVAAVTIVTMAILVFGPRVAGCEYGTSVLDQCWEEIEVTK